jgi:hypothetical protein
MLPVALPPRKESPLPTETEWDQQLLWSLTRWVQSIVLSCPAHRPAVPTGSKNVIAEHWTSWSSFGKVLGQILSMQPDILFKDFVVFATKIPRWYLKLGQDRFLPNLFKLIMNSFCHSTLYNLTYCRHRQIYRKWINWHVVRHVICLLSSALS